MTDTKFSIEERFSRLQAFIWAMSAGDEWLDRDHRDNLSWIRAAALDEQEVLKDKLRKEHKLLV
ncbi:hypothetical protein [Parvularcula sp. IMCC14364]|uniref:hypothetical protein n=1 Tax=Parvularcula sp. IMCC14364 TaxID=3067902 RepID=UPI002740C6B5|nr:hypothetical protein [Parvularcula sp. IMCC14364]